MIAIFEAYKRWRHTRGYGVHSPFAYSLVKGVVCPGHGYSWYGYAKTDRSARACSLPGVKKEARLLLRLAAFLDVSKAFIPNSPHTAPFRTALLAVRSHMALTSALAEIDSCALLCSARDLVALDYLKEYLQVPGHCVAIRSYPRNWDRILFEAIKEGTMLYSHDNLIVIARPGMQKVAYSVYL